MPPKRPVGGSSRMYRNFGRRISSARVEHKLTVEAEAERVGVTKNTVYSWEAGKTVPHGARLATLANVLELDPNDLEDLIASAEPVSRNQVATSTQPDVAPPAPGDVASNQLLLEAGGHFRLDIRQSVPIYVHVTIGPIESLELAKEPRRAS